MILNGVQTALLVLLKQALWGEGGKLLDTDWQQVEDLARDQGVLPLLYRGASGYKDVIPVERIRAWRGAMYAAVLQNDRNNIAQIEILDLFQEHNIRAVVLKGTSVARYYSPPDMRYLGDIDILIDRSKLDDVSEILRSIGYKLKEHEHGFHISFDGKGVTVEIHYAASEIPEGECSQKVEQAMDGFLENTSMATMNEMLFPVLSEQNQALMLLLHMERHMMEGGIGLRQLCDWAVFAGTIDKREWVDKTMQLLKECGLLLYAQVITKACCKFLGLAPEKAEWCHDANEQLAHEFMYDVFRAGNLGHADSESVGNIFANRNMLGNKNQSRVLALISYLNNLAYQNFPSSRKHKVLLPFLWLFLPLRYCVRSMIGLRTKKNIGRVLSGANRRQKLYKSLRLYEVENGAGKR